MAQLRGASLTGAGLALPARMVDNVAIAARLGVDERWIERRTGTAVRHFVGEDERLADLATEAGRSAATVQRG
jgi:3-oxoacyl-[acyl-carrier-protein] synthase III